MLRACTAAFLRTPFGRDRLQMHREIPFNDFFFFGMSVEKAYDSGAVQNIHKMTIRANKEFFLKEVSQLKFKSKRAFLGCRRL